MTRKDDSKARVASWSPATIVVGAVVAVLILLVYRHTFATLWRTWETNPNYSHGALIPPIVIFLLWYVRRSVAEAMEPEVGRPGVPGVVFGLLLIALALVGHIVSIRAGVFMTQGYSFVLLLFGLALALLGGRAMRVLWFPFGYLAFMLPMPPYLMNVVSFRMKLVAARVGSAIAVKLGIPLARSGMTIHIPAGSLRVADPCSGLRSLIALVALGALFAYFTRAKTWKRIVLLLAAVPLALVANTVRIAVLCAVANVWGIDAALGFFHDFSGFLLFFIALGGLFVVRGILRCGRDVADAESDGGESDGGDAGGTRDAHASARWTMTPRARTALIVAMVLLAATAAYVQFTPQQAMVLDEEGLAAFPVEIGEWRSSELKFAEIVYDELDADDTLVREYRRSDGGLIWFVIIYHENERYGAHDPMVCYRAQGWDIDRTGQLSLERPGGSFDANWALVREAGRERLAAYWWYTAGDLATADRDRFLARMASAGIRENVTFGAFIRVSTPVENGDVEGALQIIREFSEEAQPRLSELFADSRL